MKVKGHGWDQRKQGYRIGWRGLGCLPQRRNARNEPATELG
jgi:hypothetical protein